MKSMVEKLFTLLECLTLEVGPIGCPDTSVSNSGHRLSNNTE